MYRDRWRRVGLGLVLGAVLMNGGCGEPEGAADFEEALGAPGGWRTAGCELIRLPQHLTVGGVTMPTTPPKLEAVMGRIDRAGRSEFADSFAGLEVDQRRVRAIVFRVPSAVFDDFIRETAEDVCIVVRDAAHSTKDLGVWHDRVLADLPYWSHRGIHVVSIGARHDGSGVEVGTRDVERTRAELLGRYGAAAPLIFEEQDPVRPLTTGK
jgi:hypothetical protein